jgi:hypothetical protein
MESLTFIVALMFILHCTLIVPPPHPTIYDIIWYEYVELYLQYHTLYIVRNILQRQQISVPRFRSYLLPPIYTLNMQTRDSSRIMAPLYQTTHHIPTDSHPFQVEL